MQKISILPILVLLLITNTILAQGPSIDTVLSNIFGDTTLTIKGSFFSNKANPKPLFWWNADMGSTPSPLGRNVTWDTTGLGHLSTAIVAPGSQKSMAFDHGASTGAALSPLYFNTDQFYLHRKTYEDFDITTDEAIRTRVNLISGIVSVGDTITGTNSGATGKVVRVIEAHPNITYMTHIIQYDNVYGSINASPTIDFIKDEELTSNNGAVLTTIEKPFRTFNFKTLRLWAEPSSGLRNNMHISAQGFHNAKFNITPEATEGTTWSSTFTNKILYQLPREWKVEEVQYKTSSINTKDGIFNFYQKGILGTDSKFRNRTTDYPNSYIRIAQSQVSHNAQPESIMYYDAVYLDDTWHRVVISTGSTWATRGNVEIQIPTQWSDTEIVIKTNVGGLDPFVATLYLYVVDEYGIPNEIGYPLSSFIPAVTDVSMSPTSISLPIGSKTQLIATVFPNNASNKNVAWSSSLPYVASVNTEGIVEALSPGSSVITVSTIDGAKTAISTITVEDTIQINPCHLLNGLIAHWKFEGNVLDHVGSNNGTLSGGTLYESGQVGQAIRLDGINDFVDVNSFNILGNKISISAWIKADDFDIPEGRIISKASGTSSNDHTWMLSTKLVGDVAKLRFRLKTDAITSTLISTQSLNTATWYHIAATYDGGQMQLYINGIDNGTLAKTGALSVTNEEIRIGDNPPSGGRNFDGLIDDVRIYNRSLSSSAIDSMYTGGLLSDTHLIQDRIFNMDTMLHTRQQIDLDNIKVNAPFELHLKSSNVLFHNENEIINGALLLIESDNCAQND